MIEVTTDSILTPQRYAKWTVEDVSDNSTLIWTSSNTSFSVRPIEAWRLLQSMAETIWKAGDGRGDAAKGLRIFAFEDGR